MGKRYSQFTLEERFRLSGLMKMGLSKTEIARGPGRHRSTIDRELGRNSNVDGYRPDTADRRAWARRFRGSKIERSIRLSTHIEDRLAMGWSPEQIAGRMELEGVEYGVCTESIYRPCLQPGRPARWSSQAPAAAQIAPRATGAEWPPCALNPEPDTHIAKAEERGSQTGVRSL